MHKERVVISGVNGFVGHHLSQELLQQGIEIIGVGNEPKPTQSIESVISKYYSQDLVDSWPDTGGVTAVIHLAGLAAVGPSFDSPQRYINYNSAMVTNLCEYYLKQDKKPRIVIVSSGAIYSPDQPMPIGESGDIGYSSPYAVSKVLTENQCEYYRKRGLDCVIVRPFNHIGPGQAEGFILPDLYKQLSESDETGVISVGNLETRRDYTDVRDIVRAYGKIALTPTLQHTIYNVCSGESLSGMDILNTLKEHLHKEDISIEVDQSKIRPNDIMEITGDSSRLQSELEWSPQVPITQTISDFINAKLSDRV